VSLEPVGNMSERRALRGHPVLIAAGASTTRPRRHPGSFAGARAELGALAEDAVVSERARLLAIAPAAQSLGTTRFPCGPRFRFALPICS
jgi:hypothetical protein